jgi:MFS family permease
MAIYFLAMYLLGASAGPVATGWLSDYMARKAALIAGVASLPVPEQFRAAGLYHAMFALPALALVLTAVLYAGAATNAKDNDALRRWMLRVGRSGTMGTEDGSQVPPA